MGKWFKKYRTWFALVVIFLLPVITYAGEGDWKNDIGYYCPPYTESPVEGSFINEFTGTGCHYILEGGVIPTGEKYGDIYLGVVGSSTILNGHLLNSSCNDGVCDVVENDDWLSFGLQNGDDIFMASFLVSELTGQRAYFQTGGSAPSNNYGTYTFKWGIDDTFSRVIQIIEPTQATTTATTTVDIEIDYFNNGNADVLTLFLWDRVTNQQVILPVFDFPINIGLDTATTTLEIVEGSYTLQAVLFATSTGTQFGNIVGIDFNVITDKIAEIFGVNIYDPDDLLLLATTTCSITNLSGCFQNALIFAFVPSVDSFDKFIELKDLVIKKPPFGYFALLVGGLTGINATSSPAFTLASEDNITTNIFDPIKTGLTWLLWFAFGIWLYRRVKEMAL
jgi:hypothetical protein